MIKDKCDICGSESNEALICNGCIKKYKIDDNKLCAKCDFIKEGTCIISKEKVDKTYYCPFFINREKKNG